MTTALTTEIKLKVLYEEDNAEGDVTAYIPALRLGVRGDTFDEARENAKDLIAMELEEAHKQRRSIPQDTGTIEYITVSISTDN